MSEPVEPPADLPELVEVQGPTSIGGGWHRFFELLTLFLCVGSNIAFVNGPVEIVVRWCVLWLRNDLIFFQILSPPFE